MAKKLVRLVRVRLRARVGDGHEVRVAARNGWHEKPALETADSNRLRTYRLDHNGGVLCVLRRRTLDRRHARHGGAAETYEAEHGRRHDRQPERCAGAAVSWCGHANIRAIVVRRGGVESRHAICTGAEDGGRRVNTLLGREGRNRPRLCATNSRGSDRPATLMRPPQSCTFAVRPKAPAPAGRTAPCRHAPPPSGDPKRSCHCPGS